MPESVIILQEQFLCWSCWGGINDHWSTILSILSRFTFCWSEGKGIVDQWSIILSILLRFTFCLSRGAWGLGDRIDDQQSTILLILSRFTFCWHGEDRKSTFHMKRPLSIVHPVRGNLRELWCATISLRSMGLQLILLIQEHIPYVSQYSVVNFIFKTYHFDWDMLSYLKKDN